MIKKYWEIEENDMNIDRLFCLIIFENFLLKPKLAI